MIDAGAARAAQSRRRFLLGAWGAAAAMVLAGIAILWIAGRPVLPDFAGPLPWGWQLGVGTVVALGLAALASAFDPRIEFFLRMRAAVEGLVRRTRMGPGSIVLLSASAGVGEEFLFRGALMPVIGLWWSSLLFALVHGAALRRNWGAALYLALLFAGGVLLGLVARHAGLLAAMWAHTLYDAVVLLLLRRDMLRRDNPGRIPPKPT